MKVISAARTGLFALTLLLLDACGGTSDTPVVVSPSQTQSPPVPSTPAPALLSSSPASVELVARSGTAVALTVINFSYTSTATAISATLPAGWTDVTQDASACATLAPQASCTLSFIPGSSTHPATAVTIGGQNGKSTSVTMQVSAPYTANITVTGSPLTLIAGSATAGTITVTNNSTLLPATNIVADLSGTPLHSTVTQDASACVVVQPGASCTLRFTPMNTTVTASNFPIHGDNTSQSGGAITINLPTSAPISITGSPLVLNASYATPASGTFTVTNNSLALTATNISANLSATALASAITQDSSNCTNLAPGASCTLTFTPITISATSTTTVVVQGSNTSQVGASIAVNAAPLATLSASPIPLLLTPNGTAESMTITNTSIATPAANIQADFTNTALAGNVSLTANTCTSTLSPGNSCQLSFTPGSTTVSETSFLISGTDAQAIAAQIAIRTLSVGDNYAGGIVYELPAGGNPGMLVSTTDLGSPWSLMDVNIGASSNTDGSSNTALIVATLGSGNYAASICAALTDGAVPAGTWYLPAANEMLDVWTQADAGNISALTTNAFYWTSTEYAGNPMDIVNVISVYYGVSTGIGKSNYEPARCVRQFN